jgi:hypothetical protein
VGETDDLIAPYWLVQALPWPIEAGGWSLAHAAFALAPALAGPQPRDARDVLYVADTYHQIHGGRVVFFSDLAGFLDEEETGWRERRTDPQRGLRQLRHGDQAPPGLLLAVGRRAHTILADTPRAQTAGGGTSPSRRFHAWERSAIREAVALQLAADWPTRIADDSSALSVSGISSTMAL